MTFLEAIIMKLTLETPSGSVCQIGDASIRVKYCSDVWEWEYQGQTFWDVQDLAEAILQASRSVPPRTPAPARKTRRLKETLQARASQGGFFIHSAEGTS